MKQQESVWNCQRTFPGLSDAKNELVEQILHQMEIRNWTKREQFDVHLALEEAIANALKHGNASDDSKNIHVACWFADNKITIHVRDEGTGFDPDSVPDPRKPENLLNPCGRGILIIRHNMTRVGFSPNGNTIVMEKIRQ